MRKKIKERLQENLGRSRAGEGGVAKNEEHEERRSESDRGGECER